MKRVLFILTTAITLNSCTIVGNYYLLNNSINDLEVTINIRSINMEIAQSYVVRIDDISEKKIKHSTYKKMQKRIIAIDSTNKQFQFTVSPNEIAHIGNGPNTRLWNVKNVIIRSETQNIEIDGAEYGQFEFRKSGLFKYVGVKEINE